MTAKEFLLHNLEPIESKHYQTLEGLKDSQSIIYECITGSHSYGTATPASDIDIKGVFVLPPEFYPSIFNLPSEVSDIRQDVKFFELSKFMKLASECNPTIIEILWSPRDCVKFESEAWKEIAKNRNLFVSKKALNTFTGYAHAQIKKAYGQNKMVMREWPIEKPEKKDFCWIIPIGNGYRLTGLPLTMPGRPIPLKETGWSLDEFHVASLEHAQNMYRLYWYGESAKGVFRGDGMLVTESIPKDDETDKLCGFLIWNEGAYEQALKDHQRYWTWRKERNEARWEGQDGESFKYDRKNMMHCMRLVLSGKALLTTGEPIVRFEGEKLQLLRDIRAGKYEYEEIMQVVDSELKDLKRLEEISPLPDETDKEKIDLLCKRAYSIHNNRNEY